MRGYRKIRIADRLFQAQHRLIGKSKSLGDGQKLLGPKFMLSHALHVLQCLGPAVNR